MQTLMDTWIEADKRRENNGNVEYAPQSTYIYIMEILNIIVECENTMRSSEYIL